MKFLPVLGSSVLASMTRLVNKYGGVYFPMQETSGAVAVAVNPALALGRNVATLTYAAYVAGANWANSSGQIARHTAGSTATIQQDDIIAPGKTWEYVVVMSNRTAGSVAITGGDAPVSSNGSTTVTITATGTDVVITPSNDFDGDIDLAQGTVKQTNIAASTAFPGSEELTDGDMEAAGVGAWTVANSATLTKETINPHAGSQVLRIARNGVNNPGTEQSVLTVGKRYRARSFARSDGNATPIVRQGGTTYFTGSASTAWQESDFEFTAVALTHITYRAETSTGAEFVELDDVSVTEANPLNGDIIGATIEQTANGPLGLAYLFDGATDYVDISSAEINSVLDPTLGTLIMFGQSDTWAAGVDVLMRLGVDANNEIIFSRSATDLILSYTAGGTAESVTIASGSPAGMFMVALTWNTSGAGAVKAFYNGPQSGATQTIAGTFVGNLTSTLTVIGATSTVPANVWDGLGCHSELLTAELSATEIATLAKQGGVF